MKTVKFIFFIISFFSLLHCNKFESEKESKIENIQFKIPKHWKSVKGKSIDSKIFIFLINDHDSVFAEFGRFNNPFDEENNVINNIKTYNTIIRANPKTNSLLAYDSLYDYQQAIFLDNYYYYDTINEHLAKIMLPKKKHNGSIGIFFKSVDNKGNKFSIYTNNTLSDKDKEDLINVFYSVKIKQ